ncbi:MAG: hypothetical protein HOL85_18675 [Rhodospirillaceae bacterium]|jgi:hypothetical protein|nr:hypothetical protein [Rhodospirillaceae bacterium]
MVALTQNIETRAELGQLLALLGLDAVFYFVVIPAGIVDPDGFGIDQGLPPSFSARLVAILAAALMILRCGQLIFMKTNAEGAIASSGGDVPGSELDLDQPSEGLATRSLAGMAAALIFAFAIVPAIGFFPAGYVLLMILLRVLGETRPVKLLLPPAMVMVLVWVLFEQLLSIRMPVGMLFVE